MQWRNSQPEADDDEVHRFYACGQRRDPASLAATLVAHSSCAHARKSPRFTHGENRIGCQQQIVLRVTSGRSAGTSLVICEHADPRAGELTLQ
jgi:hypothetical protein